MQALPSKPSSLPNLLELIASPLDSQASWEWLHSLANLQGRVWHHSMPTMWSNKWAMLQENVFFPHWTPQNSLKKGYVPSEREFVKLRAAHSTTSLGFPLENETGYNGCSRAAAWRPSAVAARREKGGMEFLEKATLPISGLVIIPTLPMVVFFMCIKLNMVLLSLPSQLLFLRTCVTPPHFLKHLLIQEGGPCPYPAQSGLTWLDRGGLRGARKAQKIQISPPPAY